jgi:hypothetical protein
VLNSCIGVSDYNEQYSLCQPLLPCAFVNPWFNPITQRHSNLVTLSKSIEVKQILQGAILLSITLLIFFDATIHSIHFLRVT